MERQSPARGDTGPSLGSCVRRDVSRNIERTAGPRDIVAALLWSRGVQAVLLYRVAHQCWRRGWTPISEILRRVGELLYGVDMAYQSEIGPGLVLRHPHDVVVGYGARIGEDVTIYNGVTIGLRLSGSKHRRDGMPTIGDRVTLATGAKVLGPVEVGPGSMVGANAVVTRSVPAGSRVTVAAAKVVER
jgi:serine O-acetyltransferase